MNVIWTEEIRLVVALALGVLIGLEREHSRSPTHARLAGVRTHALVSLYGFGLAALDRLGFHSALPIGLISVLMLAGLGWWHKSRDQHFGWTSEIAVLLTYAIGALCLVADIWLPMALSILGTILLTEKEQIEKRVEQLNHSEFLGVLKFLLVTCIVLPVLPNEEFTRFGLNPASTWKIVVMVSSVGFAGYFLVKKLGGRAGLWVSGLVGGIVSSTAVAVATGRIARQSPEKAGAALQATLLGSSIMYLRILALVWLVSPQYGQELSWRLPLLWAIGIVLAVTVRSKGGTGESVSTLTNPFEITPALIFAGFFAAFSVASTLVREFFGVSGMVLLALIVGAVDIDPFILSVARTPHVDSMMVAAILLAMLSNTIAKGIYFGSLATPVRKEAFLRYGLWALLHLPIAFL